MATEIKNLIISEDTPSLPIGWEDYVLWLKPSTGVWRYWSSPDWVVASSPLIVVPSEVTLDTELDARMLAHEALPNIHHTSFTQTEHGALPNPHHSNALDHDGTAQDTAIAGKTTLVAVKADTDIADAITKKHTQGTDPNDHSHTNKALLDAYAQTEANLADAVTKKHTQNADSDLDATFEATLEKVVNKGAVSGYASLDTGSKVPVSQLGTGTPDGTKFLRDDRTWQTPAGGGQAFPIGSVFLAVVATNPNTLLGYGTWSQIAQGQFLVGQKATDTDFDVAEETGGAKTHTHADHPAHTHVAGTLAGDTATGTRKGGTSGAATLTDSHGHTISGVTGNPSATLGHDSPSHLPPYLVVFCWKRTA